MDVLRAARFVSEVAGTNPVNENVPVVGGHSGVTIVPLLSQTKHKDLSGETRDALVHRIQFGGDEVVQAKDGAGSATLSMAQAGARFAGAVLDGLAGEKMSLNVLLLTPHCSKTKVLTSSPLKSP